MKHIVIVAAKRTPFGRFRGALAELSPVELAVVAGNAALAGIDCTLIGQVILGNVLAAGHGMNVARQVAIKLGLPVETPAATVNIETVREITHLDDRVAHLISWELE